MEEINTNEDLKTAVPAGQSAAPCSVAALRVERVGDCTLFLGDCFSLLPQLPSFDLVLTDPPYGVTQNKWDNKMSGRAFWDLVKPKMAGACILTATEPFASDIISSNMDMFKYDLIWEKGNATGFLNANKMPLRAHENILVFYATMPTYTPQKFMLSTCSFKKTRMPDLTSNYGKQKGVATKGSADGSRYPRSVFSIKEDADKFNSKKKNKGRHPTQKPIELMEYLLASYISSGVVCDPFMGSGTTGVACVNKGLEFVGIEREEKYFDMACERISKAIRTKPRLFDAIAEQKPKPTQMSIL